MKKPTSNARLSEATKRKGKQHGKTRSPESRVRSSTHVTPSSGNVFADLGFNELESLNLRIRADLMIAVLKRIEGMTQVKAAALLGISQPRVSDLKRGKISFFTIDALVNMLARAGLEANITLSRQRKAV